MQDGGIRNGAPKVRHGPDVEAPEKGLADHDRRIFLFLNNFRKILLAHVGQVQGQDAAGIGPGRKDAFGMDKQRIPLQEETDGRIGVLEGPVHGVVRRPDIPAVSLPIVDGSGHIAQGSEITAPLDQGRVPLVAVQEGSPMESHKQRAGDLSPVLRDVQVHGQVHPRPSLVSIILDDMLSDISRIINARLYGKEVKFVIEGGENVPSSYFGDSLRIKQILLNLLGNAVKFTKQGEIKLKVYVTPGRDEVVVLHFDVSDTGIGIKKEDQAKLFNEFTQVDNRKNRKIQGTGLGLSIAKNFAKMMHGDVVLESEYGKGSTFFVTLDQKVVDDTPFDFEALLKSTNEEASLMIPENKVINEFTCPEARILIVDDNLVNLKVAKGIIGSYGAQIELSESGFDALKRLQDGEHFDILFIDHMMPEMDGVETVDRIRSMNSDYARNVPIIALTANVAGEDKSLFINAGMNDLLGKPIDTHSLAKIMRTYIPEHLQVQSETTAVGQNRAFLGGYSGDNEPEKTTTFTEEDFSFPMSGIDYRYAYDIFSGNRDSYIEILKVISEEGKVKPAQIRTLLEKKDFKNYTIEVHALKSAFLSIGAMHLSDRFREHELNGKSGNKKAIRDDFEGLYDEYSALLSQINEFLVSEEKEEPQMKSAGSTISIREYKRALEYIVKNIEFFEIDRANKEIDNLLSCKLDEDAKKRLNEAKEHMDNFMYEEAKDDVMVLLSVAESES